MEILYKFYLEGYPNDDLEVLAPDVETASVMLQFKLGLNALPDLRLIKVKIHDKRVKHQWEFVTVARTIQVRWLRHDETGRAL
jgi:hypothetical protein